MRPVLTAALVLLLAPSAAGARTIQAGLSGGTSLTQYAKQTGSDPAVFGFFVEWDHSLDYVFNALEGTGADLMLHISTNDGYGTPERVTPRGIARGNGDAYLIGLNKRLADYGKPSYVRFLAEMNQTNNAYSAFDANGRSRGPSHSTAAFRRAWQRATLILRGGSVAKIDARLKRLRLPHLRSSSETLPRPQVEMLWVPQTRGSPDIPANLPRAYWPGPKYVDWVGTDFYSRFPRFDWLNDFYAAYKGKPFVFGEWALWGADDPGFVKQLFAWIRGHRRVKLVMYNQGSDGSVFRLNRYPRSGRELKRQLRRL